MTDMHRPIIGFYGSGLEQCVYISRPLLTMNIIVEIWKHVTTKWRFDEEHTCESIVNNLFSSQVYLADCSHLK